MPTLSWYNQLVKPPNSIEPISADHANLLSLYLKNLDDFLKSDKDLSSGKKVSEDKIMDILLSSAKIFSGSRTNDVEELELRRIELNDRIKSLDKELSAIEGKIEKRGVFYLYLLFALTAGQIGFFYYTIFEIEWLGWDIMEPITYSASLLSIALAMRFYYRYGQNRGPEGILSIAKQSWLKKHGSISLRYNRLLQSKDRSIKEMKYLDQSIEYFKGRNVRY